MICIAAQPASSPVWHDGFLALLPAIVRQASIAFRHLKAEAHQDAVHEVVANALVAYARLAAMDKANLAYATPLANYGIAQVRDGRRVGNCHSVRDVLSQYAQRMKGFAVKRLDHFDERDGQWRDIVVEDRHATPADIASIRIDFADWLQTLPHRYRKIAEVLAVGERTGAVARRFRVSPARISQLRQEYYRSWQRFQGVEGEPEDAAFAEALIT